MKNLTKIFLAVAVAMFAFACATDPIEESTIGVGEGCSTFTISLEESRTQLGERNADGKYPLYWSEGDQIAINGVASNALEESYDGNAAATFQFGSVLNAPYCVVYPAVEGAGQGTTYPVNFLAEQPYTVGTFAPQAAPMYGYASEEDDLHVQMQHLTGVLRLAIAGNGEKVTNIKVTAQKGKIAGAYTVDCTTGELTPSAEAVSSLTVTFAEPLVLGAEATPVYVAVPAGNYGTFAITINTEAHQKMTVKFNSDVKPINAGSVREFSAFTYEANANDSEDVFIIDSKEALIEFARIAGHFYPRTTAKLGADIDMTGYDWTPIEGFRFTFNGDEGMLEYVNAQGEKQLPFGMKKNVFAKFPQFGYSDEYGVTKTTNGFMYNDAASFAWLEDKKLILFVQIIDRYFGNFHAIFGFNGDIAHVRMGKTAEDFLQTYQGTFTAKKQ